MIGTYERAAKLIREFIAQGRGVIHTDEIKRILDRDGRDKTYEELWDYYAYRVICNAACRNGCRSAVRGSKYYVYVPKLTDPNFITEILNNADGDAAQKTHKAALLKEILEGVREFEE